VSNDVLKFRSIVVVFLILTTVAFVYGQRKKPKASAVNQFETRCGWFDNPTPGNVWLYDRDGEWIIGLQGGYQVEDDWDFPAFKPRQWISTNTGSYGYGCACLRVRVDRETHQVLEIKSSRARPLVACRQDKLLKKWESMNE